MMIISSSKPQLLRLILVGVVSALFATHAAADGRKLFRWVDEKGVVHYGDVVPPAAAKQGRKELDDQGLTVRTIDRAKTPEELAEEQRQQRIRAELERVAREQAAYDRNLLDTYASVRSLEEARDAKVTSLQGQINLTEGNIANLRKQLDGQMNRAATLERNGKPVPEELQKDIVATQEQVQRSREFILERQKEIESVRAQFAKDIVRYREITTPRAEGKSGE